ncbi:MAG: M48 family peptidase [Proteobacteria bacterium]|nr:M48 family peptidase [Pseudomonadota bacterium]
MQLLKQGLLFASMSALGVACGTQTAKPPEATPQEWGTSVRAGQAEAEKLRNLSLDEEYKYGADLDSAIKDPARAKETGITIKTLENHPAHEYVNRIGQRLAAASDRPDLAYKFQVVEDDSINAFATMGGFVYMHTGLLKSAENEAQVAGVMAHEISHITHKHALQSMANQAVYGGWVKGVGGLGGLVIGLGTAVLFQLPGSRAFEFEADSSGFESMRRAGYPAEQMVEFFTNVLGKGDPNDGKRHDWLSTHPDTSRRVNALQMRLTPGDSRGLGLNANEHQRIIGNL